MLLWHGWVVLIDLFRYANIYATHPNVSTLFADQHVARRVAAKALAFAQVPLARYGQPTVMDMVYTPTLTPLLVLAQESGCPTVGGIQMLVGQGALAFERWTGVLAHTVLLAMHQSVIGIT